MKKIYIALASALLIANTMAAQTEVTVGVMHGKDYGVTYMLPRTELEIVINATRHTYTPGEFCRYADRYLRLSDVSGEAGEYWTLDNVRLRPAGVPDKNKVYFVKLKDKTTAPLMELTEDGIVRSINLPFSGDRPRKGAPARTDDERERTVDPRRFLTEEILMAGSTAKMAELVAKEIYNIRESKNALLRGEADNTPQDGAKEIYNIRESKNALLRGEADNTPQDGEQLKLMLDNLNLQERAMTEMFSGKVTEDPQTITIRITPREMKDEVAFRFSRKLGVVDKDDLAGEPFYLSITDLGTVPRPAAEEGGKNKKELEGVAYNVPGRAQVTLVQGNETLFDDELPITQFGGIEYLAPVLFNKNTVTKVQFDTTTGGLLKIEREAKE